MSRPINPSTNEPHNICRADRTGLSPFDIPREKNGNLALIFGECPTKTETGLSIPMRFPALMATGMACEEEKFLKRLADIINAHWYDFEEQPEEAQ